MTNKFKRYSDFSVFAKGQGYDYDYDYVQICAQMLKLKPECSEVKIEP